MGTHTAHFLLSTEQHEVLMAFEAEDAALEAVARRIKRDPSVVSKTLKAIASISPLVEKKGTKWQLTALGRQYNLLTKSFLQMQGHLLASDWQAHGETMFLPDPSRVAALLVIGAQRHFSVSSQRPRNNPDAEEKMLAVLRLWRKTQRPIIFCRHLGSHQDSPLREGRLGNAFIPTLAPALASEHIIGKRHNSAFAASSLEADLRARQVSNVIIIGFTTNHCVDASARAAHDLGFHAYVVADATASFARQGPDGRHYSAEDLHRATLATLHREYASIVQSHDLLAHFS